MGLLERLARKVDKEYFLNELKQKWYPHIKPDCDIDKETDNAWDRIGQSGMGKTFSVVGITREDLKAVISQIVGEKTSL